MGKNCDVCVEWEEEMYWTHFQSIHFSQFFLPGFDRRLPIPQKFSVHCKKKLPLVVTLKSPSGVTYNVGLEAESNGALAFRNGWLEFARDHLLEENDLLVFKFNGVSHFEVLIFDGKSLCEKATSYFVKKCCHAGSTSERHGKRKAADYSATSGAPVNHLIGDVYTTPIHQSVKSSAGNGQEEDISFDFDTTPNQRPVVSSAERRRSGNSKSSANGSALLSLAEAATSQDGFLVVMKHSHVTSKFFMTMPKKWSVKYLSDETQEVVLRIDQTTWKMTFSYCRSRNYGGLSGVGWKKFVSGNNLNEGDILVFEPTNFGTKPLLLDVGIFRVAEVGTPIMATHLQDVEVQTLQHQEGNDHIEGQTQQQQEGNDHMYKYN
ncbi:PREDICTED: B3 domain-containing protein REM16-like [Tarenaya hassleriana]|uniref:B3 domain-containing protein REM16-like n=1 Tax=Tarenaya hassleriana TaxID=28532 RepID=UPI00053C6494|nr:PREDICTED: B3 domain-containing protein REM16-like [Tarenaya hassleriana]